MLVRLYAPLILLLPCRIYVCMYVCMRVCVEGREVGRGEDGMRC